MVEQRDDPIEKSIGAFGVYQWSIIFVAYIVRLPMEFQLTNVVFVIPGVEYTCLDNGANNATNFCPCENPLYDRSAVENSVTSEFNLICERRNLASLCQSIMQVGILAGSLVYGHISDRYGRKKAIILSLVLQIVFVASSAMIPKLWMFLVFRFLIGTSVGGTMLCFYVLIIELSGKSTRSFAGPLQEISLVLGYVMLPLIAYFVRDWRNLQLVLSLPWILSMLLFVLIPESPRWLITAGRTREAVQLLTLIAKRNKRPTENIETVVTEMYEEGIYKKQQHATYIDLFRTPTLRKYSIIMASVWMCVAATYFGVNQYIGLLEGDIYLNVFISGISLLPGILIVILAAKYFSRRITIVITFCVSGTSLIMFLIIPRASHVAYLALAVIGLSAAFSAFVQVYLYATEIFPTVIRNSALGFASTFARFGGFLAPFLVNIGVETVSIIIFSALALCAAVLCCFLPETKDIVLMNTIEETEMD